MKQLIVYFLLALFCLNTFGTGLADIFHSLDHYFQEQTSVRHSHDHSHSHDHNHLHSHDHTESHQHSTLVNLMLETFDLPADSNPLPNHMAFSLLTYMINGIMSTALLVEEKHICQQREQIRNPEQLYKDIHLAIPSPPPRTIV